LHTLVLLKEFSLRKRLLDLILVLLITMACHVLHTPSQKLPQLV
jgi:hypothetical protein